MTANINNTWIILRVQSGKEAITKDKILKGFEEHEDGKINQGRILDIIFPEVSEIIIKNNEKKEIKKPAIRGHLFLKISINKNDEKEKEKDGRIISERSQAEIMSFLRDILGKVYPLKDALGRLTTLSQAGIEKMTNKITSLEEKKNSSIAIDKGTAVKVIEGDFKGIVGEITESDIASNTAKVSVEIFGIRKEIPVSLSNVKVIKKENQND